MALLVYIRHGQSTTLLSNQFTGWVDVHHSTKGVTTAKTAGTLIKQAGLTFDQAYTSVYTRAIKTLHYVYTTSGQLWIPTILTWRLNTRHYGDLQGLLKHTTAHKYGADQVQLWRRSYDVLPHLLLATHTGSAAKDRRYADLHPRILPGGTNLLDTHTRVIHFWTHQLAPDLLDGKLVVIAATGNSLRAYTK